ncbi:MAG: class I SAM-dependent methyltransferase [Roseovarius sp.]
MSKAPNSGQAEFWSSVTGDKWVRNAHVLDAAMAPALDCVLQAAALQPGERVLDIGCGTGASTLAAARRVGPGGHVTGADISPVMLEAARQRAAEAGCDQAGFVAADAQTHAFEAAAYDAMISRFGVMFFDDPVAAFANMAKALRPGGRMHVICWSGLQQNPWFSLPRQVAVDRLGETGPDDPRAPGPMAFAELDYVRGILDSAGLEEISAEEVALDLTPMGTVEEVAKFATHIGPASRVLMEKDGTKEDKAAIIDALAERFQAFATPEGVRVPAVLTLFGARRG